MYNFYLDGVLLPVTPEKLSVKIKSQNKTVTLIDQGEVNILKQPGLTEIQFDALLPQSPYPFANGRAEPAEYYMGRLEMLKTQRKPFQFIVSRVKGRDLLFDTNIKVALEDYQITEDANSDGFDLLAAITLRQYRLYGAKTVQVDNGQATIETKRDASNAPSAKTHTVVYGDTLWALAKKHLGSGARYPEIVAANPGVIIDPNNVPVGTVIQIP